MSTAPGATDQGSLAPGATDQGSLAPGATDQGAVGLLWLWGAVADNSPDGTAATRPSVSDDCDKHDVLC